MPTLSTKDADSLRIAITHLGNRLGVGLPEIADNVSVDPDRLRMFWSGATSELEPVECASLYAFISDMDAAEGAEVQEAKMRMLSPPATMRSILDGKDPR